MMTIDRFTELAQRCTNDLPERFFDRLNGGIAIIDRQKRHPRGGLFVLGEYLNHPALGRLIYLYYGSFMAVHGGEREPLFYEHLCKTLRHEFRHHLEDLAGDRSLEREDERRIEAYLLELEEEAEDER